MFKDRFVSGAVLTLLAIAALVIGGPVLIVILFMIAVGGFLELTKVTGVRKEGNKPNFAEIVGIICIVSYYCVVFFISDTTYISMMIVLVLAVFMAFYVITFPKYHANQIMALCFSFVYVPVMMSFVYMTRGMEHGEFFVWMIVICSWVSDTFAYAVGMITGKTLGNHKAFPELSPKKSWEGCVGGVIGAALAGGLLGYVFGEPVMPGQSITWMLALIGALGSVISQIGDLVASGIKRNHNIKDYGKVIPGHGGVMDRFDSMIYTAPMIYFLTILLIMK